MKAIRTITAALVGSILLYACGGTSSPTATATALTQPQVEALINAALAPVQQQVTSLQSEVTTLQSAATPAPAVFIKAPNDPSIKAMAVRIKAASTATTTSTCTGLGTLTGRPDNSDPLSTDNISGVSCTGFYFTVSGAATSSDNAIVQTLPATVTVGFDAPNCTGNAYVLASFNGTSISEGARANGAVFRVYVGANNPSDATTYWMLTPGTAETTPTILSLVQGTTCKSWNSALSAYALQQNNSTTSGVPSAPIPGPVTIG